MFQFLRTPPLDVSCQLLAFTRDSHTLCHALGSQNQENLFVETSTERRGVASPCKYTFTIDLILVCNFVSRWIKRNCDEFVIKTFVGVKEIALQVTIVLIFILKRICSYETKTNMTSVKNQQSLNYRVKIIFRRNDKLK